MGSPFPGPQSAYQNPPIEPQYFQPSRFEISNVSLGQTTTVTVIPEVINGVTVNGNYVIGQLVRLLIPVGYGCTQLNEVTGYVLSLPNTNEMVVSIDSSQNVDAFVSATLAQVPQIVAVGDVNMGIISSSGRNVPTTSVPGSFINIS